jgi:class 3 adenylate cyclase
MEAGGRLSGAPDLPALLIVSWLLLWGIVASSARRWDSVPTALLLHGLEAAFLPVVVFTMPAPLAWASLLIALTGAAALGGWRFLLPSGALMLVVVAALSDFPQPPAMTTLLIGGFLLPLALRSFAAAQRLHLHGSEAKFRSERLGQTNAYLAKHLPQPVRERAQRGVADRQLPQTCWVSVVFIDLVGFTRYVRNSPAAEIISVVDAYQAAISARATAAGGVLGKFLGDGALVYFPQRRSRREEAVDCLNLARAMPAAIMQLNRDWRRDGYLTQLQVRTGIASGYCALGDWGGDERDRLDHCIIGDCVNLASRLQEAAEPGGAMICEVTAALIEAAAEASPELAGLLGERCSPVLPGLGHTPAFPLVDAAYGHL